MRWLASLLVGISAASVFDSLAAAETVFLQAPEIAPVVGRPKNPPPPGTDGSDLAKHEFNLLPGFQVERLFTVPKEQLGSWVAITLDDKGRIIASDQGDKGLCRITPPPIGSSEPTRVERLNVKISSAQGMLQAFGALYVSANGRGLFRLKDTDGDDQYDEVTQLKILHGGGEHGEHALRLSADGKSILWLAGNFTRPPFDRQLNGPVQTMGGVRPQQLHATLPEHSFSRLIPNWDEDALTLRQWDSGGFAVGVMAPGGWIAQTDPDGKDWELISTGYRNQYDMALNADGEIFSYDADMEPHIGASWYRPTRVLHATSGSEFGWRSGTCKWPAYYVDSLPEVANIGPGSPVGVEFGYGTKFPAKYQRALYLCDWTFATIYALHLQPNGSSYRGVKEEFLSRAALPLTDAVVGRDGALYFTVGGRGNQSELYRVTYVGAESTAAVEYHQSEGADLRSLRHEVEAFHRTGADPATAVPYLVKHLAHPDRFIRYAARVGLEHIPVQHWMPAILDSTDMETVITGIVGLARTVDAGDGPKLIARLRQLNFPQLSVNQQVEFLRAFQLVLIRTGLPDGHGTLATGATMTPLAAPDAPPTTVNGPKLLPGPKTVALGEYFEPFFPSPDDAVNRELVILMVALEAPHAAQMLVPVLTRERVSAPPDWSLDLASRSEGFRGSVKWMVENQPDQLQMHIALHLRNLQTGWDPGLRKTYFSWFEKARKWNGGAAMPRFYTNIENQAFDNLTDAEKVIVEGTGVRKPYKPPELPKPVGPGKIYELAELVELTSDKLKGRSFEHGQKMFAAARCIVCHRFAGDGGATGPDLTQAAGRFSQRDLLESIVDPSKVVSDQYRTTNIVTTTGKMYTGRIVALTDTTLTMLIDPEDPTKLVTIQKQEIDEQTLSPISLMPKDLLKTLNQEEVLDLVAYLLSRGNANERYFKK